MTITDSAASHAQVMDALAYANQVRAGQAALGKELRRGNRLTGLALVADWLDVPRDDIDDALARHRVVGLLAKIPRITPTSAFNMIGNVVLSPQARYTKRIGDLTDNQRGQLVEQLRYFVNIRIDERARIPSRDGYVNDRGRR